MAETVPSAARARTTRCHPFGMIELQGPGQGVQDVGGDATERTALELGLVLDTPRQSGDLAVVDDDLGQSVRAPGLVELGTVTTGLAGIAAAGNRFTVSFERG